MLLPQNEILLSWNRCESQQKWSQVSSFVKLARDPKEDTSWHADITVFGRTIAEPSHWITPSCTQSYHNLKISFYCPSEKEWHPFNLANNLGFFSVNEFRSTTHILLAPLVATRSFRCNASPTAIRLSWSSRHLTVHAVQTQLPGENTKLALRWNKDGSELQEVETLNPFHQGTKNEQQ